MAKTKLTFYGGVNEIGGNKILLEDKGTRIFLDFGKCFSKRGKFYDGLSKPRLVNGIGDLLVLGVIPEIAGIYRPDLLALCGRTAKEERCVDAVVLSHAHSDHAAYISFLREDIPVWMGRMARTIIQSIEDERNSDIEFEVTRFKERPIKPRQQAVQRRIHDFRTGDSFNFDSIKITPVHVDHSIPGCYGFVIETSEAMIAYSGDLRSHGNRGQLTSDFVSAASEAKPDIMLCEGTRIHEAVNHSEGDVFATCGFLVKQARNSFVFADYSYKDIDRFTTFFKIAKESGRKLLIGVRAARYIQAVRGCDPKLGVPRVDDETIGIYRPRETRYSPEDARFYDAHANVWGCAEVKSKETGVITSMSSYSSDELIDIRPSGGLYIHSTSEPFSEEGIIDEERTRRWLEQFGLQRVNSHCSGHASGVELAKIVNAINPKTIVPIHTESPKLFRVFFGDKVRVVEDSIEL